LCLALQIGAAIGFTITPFPVVSVSRDALSFFRIPCPICLTDRSGEPHPVLDDWFDSLENAQEAALSWLIDQGLISPATSSAEQLRHVSLHVGLERRTSTGAWRTLRYAGLTGVS